MVNKEFLPLIKKDTYTLIGKTETKRQETVELNLTKQRETFSFNPQKNPPEE